MKITGQISETPVLSQNINNYVGHSWYIVNKCCFDFDNIKIIIVQSHFEKAYITFWWNIMKIIGVLYGQTSVFIQWTLVN